MVVILNSTWLYSKWHLVMVKNRAIDQKNQRLSFSRKYKKGDITIALVLSSF